jgi:cytochrome bd-type quinol oxidase subunit 1
VGTKLESPSIVIRVKYRGRARKHHFGMCKIPLLSVSGTESQDRWYDLNPATAAAASSSSAAQPKLRLRITCRKCYDKKSEVEVEVQLINSIIGQERDVVARNTAKIAELTAAAGPGRASKSKQKVQKLLREITHANKKIRALQAKKQVLLDKARQRKILLSQSEANFCVPCTCVSCASCRVSCACAVEAD